MAITNKFKGWQEADPKTQSEDRRTKGGDFGANMTRDISVLDDWAEFKSTIRNTYSSGHVNRFGASTQYSTNELKMVQGMITESININGITVRYMPRIPTVVDEVWNEAPQSAFDEGLQIDMYLESTSGFEGEGDIMTQYGIEFQEEVILRVSIPRFENLYRAYQHTADSDFFRKRPLEGDLIVVPFGISSYNNNGYVPKFFEIVKVTTYHDGALFQMGDNYQYKIRARLFELSYEDIPWSPEVEVVSEIGDSEHLAYTKLDAISDMDSDFLDDSVGIINIAGSPNDIPDVYANNYAIEKESQSRELTGNDGRPLQDKPKVMVKDYTAQAFGYGSIINNLDDI